MIHTFMIKCEVEGTPGSIMPEEFSEALVICFARDTQFKNAANRVVDKLSSDGLLLIKIVEPIKLLDFEWSELVQENWAEVGYDFIDDAEFDEIMNTGGVVYSPFAGIIEP